MTEADKNRHTPRLFVASELAAGRKAEISDEQAHYLLHVLRMKPGDALRLFNGRDGEWLAQVASASKRGVEIALQEKRRDQKPGGDVWLVPAPIKKAHFEYMIEKATELGVNALQPMLTGRTQIRELNLDRMRAIAIEAAEQSERLDIPEIHKSTALPDLIAQWPKGRTPVVCAEWGAAQPAHEAFIELQSGRIPLPSREGLGEGARSNPDIGITNDPSPAKTKDLLRKSGFSLPLPQGERNSVAIITGPEGGFAAVELEALRQLPGAVFIRLGPRVLRADTAAIAALTLWQALAGDWR